MTTSPRLLLLLLLALAAPRAAQAQDLGLNPDNLSFFEEPLAIELFGATVNYNQLIDVPAVISFKEDDTEIKPRTNFQVNIERQLPNALTVGGTYVGSYDSKKKKKYKNRWAIYGRSTWGQLSGGKVNEATREATRRWRGTGNADLAFDDVLGTLANEDLGAAYNLRLSAYTLNVGIDEDGNSDFGITYERPNKYVDIRVTGRLTNSELLSLDGTTLFDTTAIALVGQVEYGSYAADLGVGYEYFDSSVATGSRVFVSAGVHYKIRRLTLSAEGHLGTIDGDSETSAALGARYDLARGLSLNLGYNYANSEADIDGITIQSIDTSELITSVRYEF